MNSLHHLEARIFLLPHIGRIGGAGIYISNFISALNGFCHLEVGGKYAGEYSDVVRERSRKFSVGDCVFPFYEGAGIAASFKRYLLNFLYFPAAAREIRNASNWLSSYDVIVLTSSIQVLLIPLLKATCPGIKIVVLIQENVKLGSLPLAKLAQKLMRKADLLISISCSWKDLAERFGVKSVVVKNTYIAPALIAEVEYRRFDALYVGGDSALKGFDVLLKALESINDDFSIKVNFAGHYSAQSRSRIKKLNAKLSLHGGAAEVSGFSSELSAQYTACDFVLLPITKPHFCRPAIEAGMFGKPFVVSRFLGLDDFVQPGMNCETFDLDSPQELLRTLRKFVGNRELLTRLGDGNRQYVLENFNADIETASLRREMSLLLLRPASLQ